MRVVAWNIRASGVRKLPPILEALKRRAADVLVLSETTAANVVPLQRGLASLGYAFQHATPPTGRGRGVLIAARVEFEHRPAAAMGAFNSERWSEVRFPKAQFGLAGVYAPDQPRTNAEFWPHILEAARRRRDEQYLLMGDLNSGIAALDAESGPLPGEAGFAAMPWHGMYDLWRHRHRDRREYSWFSNRGSGFRLDHAFGTASLRRRIRGVTYHHEEREAGVSDHSMLEVSVH